MQTNKTTNVILGIIALALIAIIVLFIMNKKTQMSVVPADSSIATTQTAPVPLNNYPQATAPAAPSTPTQTALQTQVSTSTSSSSSTDSQIYTNTQYGFSFKYPSYLKQISAGVQGQEFVVILNDASTNGQGTPTKTMEVDYISGGTMNISTFTTENWSHSTTDPYTNTTINGKQAVKYDLILPLYKNSMSDDGNTPEGYYRVLQAGIQSGQERFLNVVLQSLVPSATTAGAQNIDMTWANQILNTVQLN